jgi:hypothetical protein
LKRTKLIKILKENGAYLLREGRRHTIFARGKLKTEIPRHVEIVYTLAKKILKDLEIEVKI